MNRFLLFCLMIVPGFCHAQSNEDAKEKPAQTAHSLEVEKDSQLHFLQFLPEDYSKSDKTGKKFPLMVFLHGRGESGDKLELVKKWGPPRIVESKRDFPFVLISPQCPNGRLGWNTKHVKKLIDETIKNHNIDPARVYLTGLSMGGYGSWRLAAEHPDFFAAVAPVCGGADMNVTKRLVNVPIWAFHGDQDKVVTPNQTIRLVEAIQEYGGKKIKQTIYEGVGHDSWRKAYADPALYKWFVSHQRATNRQKADSKPRKSK